MARFKFYDFLILTSLLFRKHQRAYDNKKGIMSSEDEDFAFSDDDFSEKKHQKLVDNIIGLNKKQQLRKPLKTAPTWGTTKYDSVKGKNAVHSEDLVKSVEKIQKDAKKKKKFDRTKKVAKTLPKPLEKTVENRIRRVVAYEKARLELDRWEPVVTSNRVSTTLMFPLPEKRDPKQDLTTGWSLKTTFDIEKEKSQPKVEEIQVDTDKEKVTVTYKELLEHRKQTAKLRAKQSYKEAAARRQSKIKSKKYHRLQKKQKIKEQLKEFELLQKTDPEEALKRLEEIEKIRAQERFSLRHKSTGKWAKNKQIRAKYDKESRQELAQQLTLSKELTQKIQNGSESEDDFAVDDLVETDVAAGNDNPWLGNHKVDKEVSDFVHNYRKYWSEQNLKPPEKIEEPQGGEAPEPQEETLKNDVIKKKTANKKGEKRKKKTKSKLDNSVSTSEWDVDVSESKNLDVVFDKLEKNLERKVQSKLKNLNGQLKSKKRKTVKRAEIEEKNLLELPLQRKRPKVDEALTSTLDDADNETDGDLDDLKKILEKADDSLKPPPQIDNDKFLKLKVTNIETQLPDVLTNLEDDDSADEVSEQTQQIIEEAFKDDDLIDDFAKEKKEQVDKDKPKDLNLTLPGWGSWGGTGIVPRKKKRLVIKAPPKVPRRDDNKGHLIINEDANVKIKEHLVGDVPFPFESVKDFEASIRAPIGQTFVPETAFRKLTRPPVMSRIGKIIEPMDRDVLLNK